MGRGLFIQKSRIRMIILCRSLQAKTTLTKAINKSIDWDNYVVKVIS